MNGQATTTAATMQTAPPPKVKPSGLRAAGEWRVLPVRAALLLITDDGQLARVLKGESIPKEELHTRWAIAGEIATDIPASSLTWMLEGPEPWVCKANGPDDPYTPEYEAKHPEGAAYAWEITAGAVNHFYTIYGREAPEWAVKGLAEQAARVKAREAAEAEAVTGTEGGE